MESERGDDRNKGGSREGGEILLRYFISVVTVILAVSFPVFYLVFKPLTVFPVFFILKLFYEASLNGITSLIIANQEIIFIDACIAGSAYLLLLLLNVLTRGIGFGKRVLLFLLDSAILLVLNILRLVLLIVLLVNGLTVFDFTHKLFWYVLSTVFVVAIWFLSVKIFKIKAIPFISDVNFLLQQKAKHG